jgi:glycosyltransferase involved in cell wall biosynthesis
MAQRGLLRREFSLKQLRLSDALTGAVGLTFGRRGPRLAVRRNWLWSERASHALANRLSEQLDRAGDRGTYLQIGSLVEIDRKYGPYAVFSDMTIPQAYRAGHFAVARLSSRQYEESVGVQRRVLHGCVHVFTLSDWARQSMIADFQLDPSRVTVLYTGTTLSIAMEAHVPKRPNQILFVGIDWKRKGGPLLVEGFRKLRERLPDAELVIVGCSPKIDCPGVRVEGYLHPGDPDAQRRLGRLYQESACFALLSGFEPLGHVIVEAFTVGLPVIVHDAGPQGEIVLDGQTGVLLHDREPRTIADGLYRLLSNPASSQAMGQRAKELVDAKLNWGYIVSKFARDMSISIAEGTKATQQVPSTREMVQPANLAALSTESIR